MLVGWRSGVTRSQTAVLAVLALAWIAVAAILAAVPEVLARALTPPNGGPVAASPFFGALSAFLALLAVGVFRHWRWTCWLFVVAFLFGALRVPGALLQLAGVLAPDGPRWYVLFQGLLGMLQPALGFALLVGYRRSGVWGDW